MGMFKKLVVILLFISFKTFAQTPNIGFEEGSFSRWQCYAGKIDSLGRLDLAISSPLFNRHTLYGRLYNGSQRDPYGNFPVMCPNGSNYSIKLGNDSVHQEAERVAYTFKVPNIKSYSIVFNYAVVLENPDHQPFQQPKFTVHVFDVTDHTTIECPAFDFAASSTLPGFKLSNAVGHKGESIYYKDWSTATIDLSHYPGKTIRLEFTTNDCTRGQHFGYAYLDMKEDNGNAIAGNAYCLGQRSVTLYGPTGFAQYFWYNSDMSKQLGAGKTLTLSPPPPDNTGYTLVALPYDGVACVDTLHTLVNKIDEGFRLKIQDTVKGCPGDGVDLTRPEVTAGTSPETTFAYFTDSLATSYLYMPKHVTDTGTYYIQGINKEGCMNILPVHVTIAYPEINITDPAPVDFPVTVDLTTTFAHQNDLKYSYYSDAGATKPVYNYTSIKYGGVYYVKAESSYGCQKIAKVNVVIHAPPPYTIVAPTAFTPNNDGVNDKFLVTLNGVATFTDVKIFNRYGKLVFSTKSTTGYWDGNFGGHNLPTGVYYWILDGYDDYNQIKISKGGSIALIR